MSRAAGTVIVGASIGGLTTAETLRDLGYEGAITLVGDENHQPYNRPPLSKQVLTGEWQPNQATITSPSQLERLGVELILGSRATGVRSEARVLELGRDEIPYETLVVATGVSARRDARSHLSGVHTLRTWDDAVAVRLAAASATHIVVVGAGVLGSEIAAALSKTSAKVTLVGRSSELRLGAVRSLVSPLLIGMHLDNGVHLKLGVDLIDLTGDGQVEGVLLSDGSTVLADLVIMAVGSIPNTSWFGSDLPTADGVLCDGDGQVAEYVYAVGDVARWANGPHGAHVRVEHQQNAIEQARRVAQTIAARTPESGPILPFFWSELYGTRIQAYGHFHRPAMEVIAGDISEGRFVAAAFEGDTVRGVVGWNMAREFREARLRVHAAAVQETHHLERQLTP